MKHIFYGGLYLLILGLVIWVIYFLIPKPAPTCFDNQQNQDETGVDCGGASCISCEEKNIQDLSVGEAKLFTADRLFSAIAEVRNLNTAFAAKSFDYEFDFYDSADKILKTVKNNSFISGGGSKDIIEAGVRITAGIPKRAEIKIDNTSVVWVRAENLSAPPYNLEGVVVTAEDNQIVVSGNITNPNNFLLSKVIINSFLIDRLGDKIGASKTEFRDVGPFRVQSFKIFIPADEELLGLVDMEETTKGVFVEVFK
ncbi:MAG: hypothetical protein HZB99_01295 [Candidatus Harrisonbacteria bacterium]|nr:hypothetical protein [Candidatus Harrisonbacteria bacterium]